MKKRPDVVKALIQAVVCLALIAPAFSFYPARPALANEIVGDEWEQTDPTVWNIVENKTASQLTSYLSANNERIVDLEVAEAGAGSNSKFVAITVSNTGAYAKASWWFPALTATQVNEQINALQARLIDIEAYAYTLIPYEIRYAVVLVPNSGADYKGWAWFPEATTTFISDKLDEYNARLVDLSAFTNNSGERVYAAVMIGNSGPDLRTWGWLVQVPWSAVDAELQDGRLVDIIREGDDSYTVVYEDCPCSNHWHFRGLTTADLRKRADQLGARIVDIAHRQIDIGGVITHYYEGIMIENLNVESRRISEIMDDALQAREFGLYLKEVGGPVLAELMADYVHEPLSSIKVIAHLVAMREVQAGNIALSDQIPAYVDTGLPGEDCRLPDGTTKSLYDTLFGMLRISSNEDWAATVYRFGEQNIKDFINDVVQMSHTELRRVNCADRNNRWTLRDIGMLYEGVADRSLISGGSRTQFFDLMRDDSKYMDDIVFQEAPAGMSVEDINLFISLFKIANKDGGWNVGAGAEHPAESAITRIGVARIPSCFGVQRITRYYAYGMFMFAPQEAEDEIVETTHTAWVELMRLPLREALADWGSCSYNYLGSFDLNGAVFNSPDGFLEIDLPAGVISGTVNLFFNGLLAEENEIPAPGDIRMECFALDAADTSGLPVEGLLLPYRLTLNFPEAEVQRLGGMESDVRIAYFDDLAGTWVYPPVTIDFAANTAAISLDHFSEFALTLNLENHRLFLPAVSK